MTAGRLQEKNGKWYMVLSYTDPKTGKRKQPWFATGLPVRGNKKKAEEMLSELRSTFVIPESSEGESFDGSMDFARFMLEWLSFAEHTIARTTYASYQNMVMKKNRSLFQRTSRYVKGAGAQAYSAVLYARNEICQSKYGKA